MDLKREREREKGCVWFMLLREKVERGGLIEERESENQLKINLKIIL